MMSDEFERPDGGDCEQSDGAQAEEPHEGIGQGRSRCSEPVERRLLTCEPMIGRRPGGKRQGQADEQRQEGKAQGLIKTVLKEFPHRLRYGVFIGFDRSGE
jgi:hypothetical protein